MENKSVTVNITKELFDKSLKDCRESGDYTNKCVISQAIRQLAKKGVVINTSLYTVYLTRYRSDGYNIFRETLPNKALDIRKKFDRIAGSKGFARFIYNLFARKTLQFEINVPQEYLK